MNKLKYFGINLGITCVMILLLLLVTSVIFAYTNINDKYLDIFVYCLIGISIFLNSIFLNRKIKSKGAVYGSIFGLLVIVTIYLIGAIFLSFSLSYTVAIYLAVGVISGLIGGIIGVNL
ncbi:MAG: TIGR04086 family membrane protein [Clostridia bacterium]|nr:TIGR04086 family membrane protein [Clostridia bacterium]MDD4386801.1 TIGR04086 family membrane protein [Clostridia bacterium]